MTDAGVVSLGMQAIQVALTVAAPVLLIAAATGVLMGLFQAVTQIQEVSLSFIPKILAVSAVVALFGPWMLRTMVDFTTRLLSSLPGMVR
ncbi:MAG: flagellar biosynthesis protein FliQ [Armatimonadota bacterium]